MIEKIRKVLKSKGGFTLVELLVVIVVLGILSGIGVQRFGAVTTQANQTAHNANKRILAGAAQMYMFGTNNPTLTRNWGDVSDATEALIIAWNNATLGLQNYIEGWPKNPVNEAEHYVIEVTNGSVHVKPIY